MCFICFLCQDQWQYFSFSSVFLLLPPLLNFSHRFLMVYTSLLSFHGHEIFQSWHSYNGVISIIAFSLYCLLSSVSFIVEGANRFLDRAQQFASYKRIHKLSYLLHPPSALAAFSFSFLLFLTWMFSVVYCVVVVVITD